MTIPSFVPARPEPTQSIEVESVGPARQVAALAWRPAAGGVDVLLITSRIRGNWLLPKGWPMAGLSAVEAAAQEAFEEAGVWGEAVERPIGTYHYDKLLKDGSALPCVVDIFAIRTLGLLSDWPEKTQRRRRWYTTAGAATQVLEPDLARFLRDCGGLVGGTP